MHSVFLHGGTGRPACTVGIIRRHLPREAGNQGATCDAWSRRERFTVHGLWKNFDTGRWPSFCSHTQFDAAQLAPLRPSLDQLWPSYYGPSESFWVRQCRRMKKLRYALASLPARSVVIVLSEGGSKSLRQYCRVVAGGHLVRGLLPRLRAVSHPLTPTITAETCGKSPPRAASLMT